MAFHLPKYLRQDSENHYYHRHPGRSITENKSAEIIEIIESRPQTQERSGRFRPEKRQLAGTLFHRQIDNLGIARLVQFEMEPIGKMIGSKKYSRRNNQQNNGDFSFF
jgi:hypothetical protein